jgi:hypothetical protein
VKGDPVPEEHHVLRHCSGTSIEKDDAGKPIGVTADAFDDDDPEGISVTWVEYFAQSDDPDRAAIEAIRTIRPGVRPTHRFGKFNVGLIKTAGMEVGVLLGVEHDPISGNDGHSLITGLVPNEHANLMNRLALDVVALLSPI